MSARDRQDGGTVAGGVRLPPEVADRVLTPEAVAFHARLEPAFAAGRAALLARRADRQKALDAGADLYFLPETRAVREDAAWRVAPAPADLERRHIEITG